MRDSRRWLAYALSIAGLLIVVQWVAANRPHAVNPKGFLPTFVTLTSMGLERYPVWGGAGIWFTAMGVATACGLALFLARKSPGNEAALQLSLALGAGGLSVAYFYLVLLYPIGGRPASEASLPLLSMLDAAGYAFWFLATWQLARVFQVFPQTITNAGWERHVAAWLDATHAEMSKGWRRRLYPAVMLPPKAGSDDEIDSGKLQELFWQGMNARRRARMREFFLSPKFALVLGAIAVACAAGQYVMRVHLLSLPPGTRVEGPMALIGELAPGFCTLFFGCGAAALAYAELEYHRKWGSDDDRRRIAWIYSTVFACAVLFLALLLGGFGLFVGLVFFALDSLTFSLEPLLLFPFIAALPLVALAVIVSLALSVLYRGVIDPRHAARRLTLWGLLAIAVAVLFVIFERAVALKVAHWMSLPSEWGPILAGALAAGTLAPVRSATERAVNDLVARYLPPDAIASGQRRDCAVGLCDLSGYTALSGSDEKQALLLAALLQQKAARIAAARRGRVVKSMGDAVLLDFPDPRDACEALQDLHAQFPLAAIELGVTPLALHSGSHFGEVVVGPDGDIYGQTVNLAARLQGEARDGQIVVSEALATAAALPPERLQSLGARKLKNVQEPVACFLLSPARASDAPVQASVQREAIPR